jgi:hypothetical protein
VEERPPHNRHLGITTGSASKDHAEMKRKGSWGGEEMDAVGFNVSLSPPYPFSFLPSLCLHLIPSSPFSYRVHARQSMMTADMHLHKSLSSSSLILSSFHPSTHSASRVHIYRL